MKIKNYLKLIAFSFLFISITINAQDDYKTIEDFKFKFIKANKARGKNYGYTIVTKKDCKRIQVRFKIKSLSDTKFNFDANKIYLVIDDDKTRISAIDVRNNFAAGWIFVPFDYLSNNPVKDEKLSYWLNYKPEIKNTFLDYKIDGYKDIFPNINFGTKRKPKYLSPYFDLRELKSCKIDAYFSIPKSIKNIKIYYGSELLKEIRLKK